MESSRDRMAATGQADAFAAFRDLYEQTILRIIAWSEGEILEPQYMHLHEANIGTENGYELGQYLIAFIDSLGAVQKRLERIVFCYSYEKTDENSPTCNPADCKHELFYWYEFHVPLRGRTPSKSDITWPGGDVTSKPTSIDEHTPVADLQRVLGECHWVQPYMLRESRGGIDAQFELVGATPECINTYRHWHSQPGNYQFTIYGYELREGETLTEPEQLLLNLAFLVHIWTWNHELRTAHVVRRVAADNLPRTRRLWSELSNEMEGLLDALRTLNAPKSEHVNLIPLSPKAKDELFDDPHDLGSWTPANVPGFLERAHGVAAHRRLREFLTYCGWPDAGVEPPIGAVDVTAARGCWLATKYLTRCALDGVSPQYKKASFDQLLLATLFGLHEARATDVPVHVTRSVEFPSDTTLTELEGLVALQLAYQEQRHNWPNREFVVATESAGNVHRFSAHWSHAGTGGRYLPAFLRSGMLAMQMARPTLHVFELPPHPRLDDPPGVSAFLYVVSRLARALAAQQHDEKSLAKLMSVHAELRTLQGVGTGQKHRARIRFELDRSLPPQVAPGAGQISGPLTALAEWCGAREPIRIEGSVESTCWHCFIASRGDASDILLTFVEGEAI